MIRAWSITDKMKLDDSKTELLITGKTTIQMILLTTKILRLTVNPIETLLPLRRLSSNLFTTRRYNTFITADLPCFSTQQRARDALIQRAQRGYLNSSQILQFKAPIIFVQ